MLQRKKILFLEIFKEMSCYNVESLEDSYFKSNILITSAQKRDKVSIAITSCNFILYNLFGCTTRIYFMFSLCNLH